MRMYQPIWLKLKALPRDEAAKVGVSVSAPRALHRRIVKAIKKEKWMDIEHKLEIEPYASVLANRSKHSILTFTLTYTRVCSFTLKDF